MTDDVVEELRKEMEQTAGALRKDLARTRTGRLIVLSRSVCASLESLTRYAAVDLDAALAAALTKHESELREKERRKRDLRLFVIKIMPTCPRTVCALTKPTLE